MFCNKTIRYCMIVPSFILLILLLSFLSASDRTTAQAQTDQVQLTGLENHSISLSDAARLTKNFRGSVPPGSVLGEYFGGNAIQSLLKQYGCIGIRIYYAKKDDGNPTLVIVGVNKSGNDMTNELIIDHGFPCPPICDTANVFTR